MESVTDDVADKYSYEEIYNMLGGSDNYYPECQIEYIFHKINGRDDKAASFYEELQKINKTVEKAYNLMKENEKKVIEIIEKKDIVNNNDDE